MTLSVFPPSNSGKQNFYGLKFDPTTAVCQIDEILFGDTSEAILMPQLNDDGTFFSRSPEDYISTALTPFELSFSWDTTDESQLIMEVE
jgi:hypothetical protein